MNLVNASHTPPTSGPPDMTVSDACSRMVQSGVASIGIVDETNRLIGLFQEQDLADKIIPRKLDPEKTLVREVMTSPCKAIGADQGFSDALHTMLEENLRHLPVVDANQHLLGVISLRSMLMWKIDDLDNALRGVTSYLGADGIGG